MMRTGAGFYGWKLLAALFVIIFVNLGFALYASAILNAYMTADLRLDRSTLGLLFSTFMLLSGTSGPLVAWCIGKVGVRWTLAGGSGLVCLGAIAMGGWVSTGSQAVLAFGVLIGLGVGIGGLITAQTSVTRWFVRQRTFALSIVLSASGVGGFVAAPVAARVVAAFGDNWRVGWILFAVLSAASTLLAIVAIREQPSDLGQAADGGEGGVAVASTDRRTSRVHVTWEVWTFREAIRSSKLWLLLMAVLGMGGGITFFLAHGVVHLQDLGYTAAAAAASVSVLTLTQLAGTFGVGLLGDRIELRHLWSLCLAIFAAGLLLASKAHGPLQLYTAALCLGTGFGGSLTCMMTIPGNYFGSQAYPAIVGLLGAVSTLFGVSASYIAGLLYDRSQTYVLIFAIVAGLSLAGAALLQFATPPSRPRRDPESADVPSTSASSTVSGS